MNTGIAITGEDPAMSSGTWLCFSTFGLYDNFLAYAVLATAVL